MATNTNPFYTYSATAGSSKSLQKPQDGGDNNQWGNYINTDLDEIVSAVNALSDKIADANEKTLVDFTATTDAVNHVGVTNAATGNGPTISSAGTDSNVDLNVTPKGTGDSVFTNKIKVDDVIEKTTDHGVEIEGVLVKDSIVKTDDIYEKTTDHGVGIDGVLVKDGDVGLATISSKVGTSVGVTLGTDSGDDFNVGSGKLVVEGDTGNVGIGGSYDGFTPTLSVEGTNPAIGAYKDATNFVNTVVGSGNVKTFFDDSSEMHFAKASNRGGTSEATILKLNSSGAITTPSGSFDGTVGSGATITSGIVIPDFQFNLSVGANRTITVGTNQLIVVGAVNANGTGTGSGNSAPTGIYGYSSSSGSPKVNQMWGYIAKNGTREDVGPVLAIGNTLNVRDRYNGYFGDGGNNTGTGSLSPSFARWSAQFDSSDDYQLKIATDDGGTFFYWFYIVQV